MSYYRIIKKHIDEMDYYSLLLHGAPGDEFDAESSEISRKITGNQTETDIAQIIAEVFNSSFARNDPTDFFTDCARKIYDELKG